MMSSIGHNEMSTQEKFSFLDQAGFKERIKSIYKLDLNSITHSWKLSQWEEIEMSWSNYRLAVVEQDEFLCCFALWYIADGSCAHLLKIATSENFLRKGIGNRVLRDGNSEFRELGFETAYLEVAINNKIATALYMKLGYQIVHTKSSFYSDGTDAYAMQLKLN